MSGSERPHLRPVDDAAPAPAGAERAPARRGPPWIALLLAAAVLVCAGGWVLSARETARLEAELAATRTSLAEAEARTRVLEGYVGAVRDRFATLRDTLQGELESLAALLAADPD